MTNAEAHATAAAPPAADPVHLDPELTAPAFLRGICERHRDRSALVFEGREWTYGHLHDEVLRMEAALLALGAGKGTRVAVLMGARPEWVVTTLAAMGIGAVAVPISTYEPAQQRHALLRHADASILVLQDRLLGHTYLDDLVRDHPQLLEAGADSYDPALPYLRHVVHLGDDRSEGRVTTWSDALARGPRLAPEYVAALEAEIHPMDDALIIYTSGTSGTPKGVVHAHRSVAVQFERLPREFTIASDDVVWGSFPLFWSAGIAWVLGATLAIGAELVLQEWFEPVEALRLVEERRVTTLHATPPQLAEMEEALARRPTDLSSIRILPRGSLAGHVDLPPDAPFGGASLGLTETLTLATSIPWDAPVDLRLSTNGRPLPGTLVKIVEPTTSEALPVGAHGEIALKGTTLMTAYHKRFPETYLDDCGYYRTGDAGFLDEDGYLHWTGRMTQLIRTNSANVSPSEVEGALHELPGVKLAAALGVPDPDYGEVVVACVVPKPGTSPSEHDLRARLKDKLAAYKIPRRIFFLAESELELTATGKPRLTKLREIVEARTGSQQEAAERPAGA